MRLKEDVFNSHPCVKRSQCGQDKAADTDDIVPPLLLTAATEMKQKH